MKYILFESEGGLQKRVVIFPESLTHKTMAKGVIYSNEVDERITLWPASAGFIDLATFTTYGKSESMGLSSRKEDAYYAWGGDAVAFMGPEMIKPLYEKYLKEMGYCIRRTIRV